jgi:hypothetical protein
LFSHVLISFSHLYFVIFCFDIIKSKIHASFLSAHFLAFPVFFSKLVANGQQTGKICCKIQVQYRFGRNVNLDTKGDVKKFSKEKGNGFPAL